MRPSSATTKSSIDLLPCRVWETTALDGRECILDAMVELGQQSDLLFLHPFALGYVNADADDSVRASFAIVGNETARLDPTHFATSTNDAILHAIFAPARTERLAAELFHPPYVVAVHAEPGIRCVPPR